MSALAKLALHQGCKVFGSDIVRNQFCIELEKLGAQIFYCHSSDNLASIVFVPDLFVYSSAIKPDNIEMQTAKIMGIKIFSRAQFLGQIAKGYQNVIAVSGMHGKTTTTAMIAKILISAANPTVHIGGDFGAAGGNLRIGENQYFVTEACEYADSFLWVNATHAVVTNIEREHMDYFKTMSHIKKSFAEFASKARVCYVEYDSSSKVVANNKKTFGINRGDLKAVNIKQVEGKYNFDVVRSVDRNCKKTKELGKAINKERLGEFLGRVELCCAGRHNIFNALAAIFVCLDLGVPFATIKKALFEFENVKRRFEKLGEKNGNIILHDYAHHPTEIKNAIKTTAEAFGRPIICVFQPHTYSRTKTLLKKFLTCFDKAEQIYIIDTYSAREPVDPEGDALKLFEALKDREKHIKSNCRAGVQCNAAIESALKNKIKEARKKQEGSKLHEPVALCNFDTDKIVKKYKDHAILFLGAGDIEELARKASAKVNK